MEEIKNETPNTSCFRNLSTLFLIILLCYTSFLIQVSFKLDTLRNIYDKPNMILDQLNYFKNKTNASITNQEEERNKNQQHKNTPFRILHIVTALDQYGKGKKFSVNYNDRLTEILIPTLKGTVNSFLQQPNWSVDVYLILGFNLSKTPLRRKLVEDALPDNVSLEIWDEATPYGYDDGSRRNSNPKTIRPITRALARQHRYVIKDKLEHYDFFTAFEDDMRITSHHILAFKELSQQLEQIKEESSVYKGNVKSSSSSISGPLTVSQLERVIPGFFRVEVLQGDAQSQSQLDPIPVDLDFHGKNQTVNPEYCCAVSEQPADHIVVPVHPKPEQLMTWETAIKGFSVSYLISIYHHAFSYLLPFAPVTEISSPDWMGCLTAR